MFRTSTAYTRNRGGRGARFLIGVLALLTLASCSASPAPLSQPVLVEGSDLLPSATARDWSTFSDALVKITVISEEEVAPSSEEVASGEGVVGRLVSVHVDDTLWQREGAPTVPSHLTWSAGGWFFSGSKARRPMVTSDAPEISVGHTYLVPLARTNFGDSARKAVWVPLSATAVLPYDDGVIGTGVPIINEDGRYQGDSKGATPLRDEVWGESEAKLSDLVSRTSPDPRAENVLDQDPVERLRAVQSKSVPAAPGPGEK